MNKIIIGCICFVLIVMTIGLIVGPLRPILITMSENAKATNAEAQANLTNANAALADKQADLVTARGNVDALNATVKTANGIVRWWGISFPLAPPLYIMFGVVLGLAIGCPSGALFMSERKRSTETMVANINYEEIKNG